MRKVILTVLVALGFVLGAVAQERTISGKVTDEKGVALEGVSVTSSDNKKGTTTNKEGVFVIVVSQKTKKLVFSSVNFDSKTLTNLSNNLSVVLKFKDDKLEDVVVTGYTVRKKDLTPAATSKVTSKQIAQVPLASFEQILQGRAPGLYIASGSGQPGTSARVNIRGVGTINGNTDPLYVLDGIPIEAGIFRSLNPNDFETVDVLKDAASAGAYGARAGNGVIVITSKKGKVGKTVIQYRGQMGFSDVPSLYNVKLMNTAERLKYEAEFLGPSGVIAATNNTGYPGWDWSPNNPAYQAATPANQALFNGKLDSVRAINTNWADLFFRRATFKQHELNASGGSNNVTFFTSLSAYSQEGIIIRSNLDRYTFRGNVDFKTEKFTASIRSSAGFSASSGIESEAGVALANPVAAAYLELPYRALNKAPGVIDTAAGRTGPNAYDRLFTSTNLSNQFKGNLGITLQYKIWNGISAKTVLGVDYRNNNNSRFIDPNQWAGKQLTANGAQGLYNENFNEQVQLLNTSGLEYSKTFNKKHVVNALAMFEVIREQARFFGATGYGINSLLPNTPAGITSGSPSNNFIPLIGGGKDISGLYSTFFVGDYTYDKRYTLSASFRRDVTSKVPQANRAIQTATFGLNWNIINEAFMKKQNVINDARIRFSYGELPNIGALTVFKGASPDGGAVGANAITNSFNYLSSYGTGSYAGTSSIIPTSPGNPDYKIESQVITNLGFDLAFWNKRLRIKVDAFKKESKNLFVSQGLSRTAGFNTLNTNAGKMENKGLDFSVDADLISKNDFMITLGFNGGFLKNTITDLGALTEIPQGTGIIKVGVPLGTHYTVGFKGINPQNGLPIYEDVNGNPTTDYNAINNRAAFGTYLPTFTGGASLDITWKGFNISALLSTAQGVQRFNNESFFYETTNSNIQFNKSADLLTSWKNAGDISNFQKINSPRQFSSRDISDASFVRLRNIQAGYTFTSTNNKFIRGFRVWGQAQNLYTWTKWRGFDPEESNNIATYEFPNPRTYTIGLDINF